MRMISLSWVIMVWGMGRGVGGGQPRSVGGPMEAGSPPTKVLAPLLLYLI